MGKKLLELHLISAQDVKVSTGFGKVRTYAVAWIRPSKRFYTHVDEEGGSSPVWNEKLVMSVDNFLLERDSPAKLNVDIFHRGHTHDRIVGTVEIPLRDISRDAKYTYGARSSELQYMAYEIRRPSGRLRGVLNVAVRIRERSPSCSSSSASSSDEERARRPTEYPAPYPPRPAEYPPRPAEYPTPYSTTAPPTGYPTGVPYGAPMVPPAVPPPSYYGTPVQRSSSSSHTALAVGAGLAAGALGGLVLGEVMENMEEHAAEEALQNVDYGDDYGDDGDF